VSKVVVPPYVAEIDGAKVVIVDVVEKKWLGGKTRFLVSCYIEWRGKRSQPFFLDVASNSELLWKLKAEVAKFKLYHAATT